MDSIGEADVESTNEFPVLLKLINDSSKAILDANSALNIAKTMNSALENNIKATNVAISSANTAANNANIAKDNMIREVNEAIAADTQDLEVKQSRTGLDGTEYANLNERLKAMELNPYILYEEIES